jgi:monofunctional biosynthetic peptidoglycan transglycosylase
MKPGAFKSVIVTPLLLLAWCALALQLALVLRIALMAWVDPRSTSFQRSEIWRLAVTKQRVTWSQTWTDDDRISPNLNRAVIASEDDGFDSHFGFDWDAMWQAWKANRRTQARAGARPPKLRGGSTITQQLAKNLLMSGERTNLRKVQELVPAVALELLLGKRRILELYLNHVDWGEGVFGAQAAARHYFGVDADHLGAAQAARLAVMLPAPKRYGKPSFAAYVAARGATIQARMAAAQIP